MNVLVTGAGGFVGRHLVASLEAQGHSVSAPGSSEADLTRDGALDALDGERFDTIYHLAVWTRAGRFCLERGGDQWVVNSRINTNVLDWWATRQPQAKLVAFGTSASYAGSGVHREEDYLRDTPPEGYYGYAMTKRMLLAGLEELGRQHELRWLYLVPSTVYGPGYHTDGRDLHFVYDLARKIVRGKRYGDDVVLWGDGTQRRELVHVDEVVHVVEALAAGVDGEVVNVGEGADHSIREIAAELCDAAGFDFDRVQFDPNQFVGAKAKILSTEKLDALLPDRPRVPLRAGLEQVVEWVEANLDDLG